MERGRNREQQVILQRQPSTSRCACSSCQALEVGGLRAEGCVVRASPKTTERDEGHDHARQEGMR
jgi:hypothetical protein